MAPRYVPVTLGSPRFRIREVGPFQVVEAWFPPGLVLAPHVHERAVVGVMLDGAFDHTFPGRIHACPASTLLTEPVGEKHGNRMSPAGAHVLVIQPDVAREELCRPLRPLLERVHNVRHGGIADRARRLAAELGGTDTAASLAIEAAVLEVLALAVRAEAGPRTGRPPAWLARAREIVEDRYRERLTVEEVAAEVGIHPAHLARVFRERFREPIGAYVRRRRLEWAAARLASGDDPLASIAFGAGFADQSHFTRAFRAWSGVTPASYRRTAGGRDPAARRGPR